MSTRKVTTEQLQALERDEQISMLFYLTGYLEKNPQFQEALAAAYAAQMRMRVMIAERDREGLALVKAIHDRKQASE